MRLVRMRRRNGTEVWLNPAHVLQVGSLRPSAGAMPPACWIRFIGERSDEETGDLHVLGTIDAVTAALEGERR
jgi:hypothetical protein